jgi:isopentenyl-diphosphate Delta-isomerase
LSHNKTSAVDRIQQVILVDERDQRLGEVGKMEAHEKGLLHRAFSIFIFNSRGEMLLQQRALSKYHSGGLWTNSCCSHPIPGEDNQSAALRRLKEEMGFETSIDKIFDFVYKAEFDNGLTEYEFDHVFVGEYEGPIIFNKDEVMDICYKPMDQISDSLQTHPQKYTRWFQLSFARIENWWAEHYKNQVA